MPADGQNIRSDGGALLRRLVYLYTHINKSYDRYLGLLAAVQARLKENDSTRLPELLDHEQSIIRGIKNLLNTIRPLEELPEFSYLRDNPELAALRQQTAECTAEASQQIAAVEALLRQRLDETRLRLEGMKRFTRRRSSYGAAPAPRAIDING